MAYTANKTAGEMWEAYISGVTVMLHRGDANSGAYVPVQAARRGTIVSGDYQFTGFNPYDGGDNIGLYAMTASDYPSTAGAGDNTIK